MVTSMRISFAAVFLTLTIPAAAFAQGDAAVRVLIPVTVHAVPGAYGSLWSTQLRCLNLGEEPVTITPVTQSHYVAAPGWTQLVPAGALPPERPGVVLNLLGAGAGKVQFDLRLFNDADRDVNWGTEVPVVREDEFRDAIDLLNVPTSEQFRMHLRIYSIEDVAEGERAVVSVWSDDDRLFGETEVPLLYARPAYAALSVADTFPSVRELPRVRVRVTTRSGQTKLWAFISITSNTTQRVSVVTPD
jgi:hypothetical protein